MSSSKLVTPIQAREHLNFQKAAPEFAYPSQARKLVAKREKTYRLMLHSDDRVSGTPTACIFDIGDLKGAWGLADNIDVGSKHFYGKIDSFYMVNDGPSPIILEIHGDGFSHQSESFDSSSGGPSTLLGVAASGVSSYLGAFETHYTMRNLPNGRVGIRLVTRDNPEAQEVLAADTSMKWHLVFSVIPQYN
jgi:hypothetical protein